eukprot:XP_016664375.1 PREDICTED: zinc finger MYM-type protein 3-like [Acyrthosiphon pisum]
MSSIFIVREILELFPVPRVVCDHCEFLCLAHYNTIHIGTTYFFCSQKCLNSFQLEKKQKIKPKSKNGKKSSASQISIRQSGHKEDNNIDSDGIHNSQQKNLEVKQNVGRKTSLKNSVSKVNKEVQTDRTGSKPVMIPITMPTHKYVTPYPVPVPFPIPLPIPIVIPPTKNTTKAILKDIKKMKEETPDDPWIQEADEIPTITSHDQRNQIIDDVEANLVSSTIMPQAPDATENMLCRLPRKRASCSQSQHNLNSKCSRKTDYPQAQYIPAGLIQQVVQNPLYTIPMSVVKPDANMCLKYKLGVNAWRQWAYTKSIEFEKKLSSYVWGLKNTNIFKLDLLQLTANELNYCLCLFVKEVRKPNGSEYEPDTIYYLCLGIQQYLFENGRIDNIFTDMPFEKFTDTLNEVAKRFTQLYNDTKYIRVKEEYLWESKQLGAHSPYSIEEHIMQLSFSHIIKYWKINPNQPSTSGVIPPGTYRNLLLRYYPSIDLPNSRKKKVYEQHENEENSLRCPVKLYEFYLSKCPESVRTRHNLFYLTPERSYAPDSPVWYSTCALNKESLEKILNRVKMVKEINEALLSS